MVLEKTLESPLDSKKSKPVNPKGNQSWIFTGKTDAEAEAPVLLPPDVKTQLIRKDPDAGKIEVRRRRGWQIQDEMVGWHHHLDGHEFKQALGIGDEQGSLVCCSPWSHKESDIPEQLNWTELGWRRQIRRVIVPNGSSHNLVQKLTLSIPMANRKTGTRIYHNARSFLRETVYQIVWNGKHFLALKGREHIIFKFFVLISLNNKMVSTKVVSPK